MATGTNGIATVGDLGTTAFTWSLGTTQCPKKSVILSSVKSGYVCTIPSTYTDDQLVKYSDITISSSPSGARLRVTLGQSSTNWTYDGWADAPMVSQNTTVQVYQTMMGTFTKKDQFRIEDGGLGYCFLVKVSGSWSSGYYFISQWPGGSYGYANVIYLSADNATLLNGGTAVSLTASCYSLLV